MKHHSETDGEYRKYKKPPTQGKGDVQRPTNREVYREGWERIFGKRKHNKRDNQSNKPAKAGHFTSLELNL
jgi:hypothetical protein